MKYFKIDSLKRFQSLNKSIKCNEISKRLVLLKIFSYSCMNCLRSLKYINKIDDAYSNNNFLILLIHTNEWNFEKNIQNIKNFLKSYKIRYPVLIDKNKKITKNLRIDFWPSQVLIKNNKIVYYYIGEGSYKPLEETIRKILKIKKIKIFKKEPQLSKYPSFYLGKRKNGKIHKLEKILKVGTIYTQGNWFQTKECLKLAGKEGTLTILVNGKIINFVAKSEEEKKVKIDIALNGKSVKTIDIEKPKLYNLLSFRKDRKNIVTISVKSKIAVYSFSSE